MPGHAKTQFAPAERDPLDEVLKQFEVFIGTHCRAFFDALPTIILALNCRRQIVFANLAAAKFLGQAEVEFVLGKRPGEVLGCINAQDGPGGCGTSLGCKNCGMVQAILRAIEGGFGDNECQMLRRDHNLLEGLDLHANATPLSIQGFEYIIFALTDITHETRRRSMERIFFHDVLNLAGGISGLVEVISDQAKSSELGHEFEILHSATKSLVDEILAQRELVSAENHELSTAYGQADTCALLRQLKGLYEPTPLGQDQEIVIEPTCHEAFIETDIRLVQRVLGNMLKNALEAGEPGDVVRLDCLDEGDSVRFCVRNRAFIPPDVQNNIFRRRFSTKGDTRGLGTYSMLLLAEQYLGGRVGFSSSGAEGTSFELVLPKRAKSA